MSQPLTAEQQTLRIAKAIFWAAYDGYLRDDFKHPQGLDRETAWELTSEFQRRFCMHQAYCAMLETDRIRQEGAT